MGRNHRGCRIRCCSDLLLGLHRWLVHRWSSWLAQGLLRRARRLPRAGRDDGAGRRNDGAKSVANNDGAQHASPLARSSAHNDLNLVERALRRQTFGTLSTLSVQGLPHAIGVVYALSPGGEPLIVYVTLRTARWIAVGRHGCATPSPGTLEPSSSAAFCMRVISRQLRSSAGAVSVPHSCRWDRNSRASLGMPCFQQGPRPKAYFPGDAGHVFRGVSQ